MTKQTTVDAKARKPWADKACRSPAHERARRIFREALTRGDIFRPSQCEKCKSSPPPMKDGRASIQGHHTDYSQPLAVEWLCYRCHRDETPARIGSQSHTAKINEDQAAEIRHRAQTEGRRVARFSRDYGISPRSVRRILDRETWRHV